MDIHFRPARLGRLTAALAIAALLPLALHSPANTHATASSEGFYQQINLVSDIPGVADATGFTDTNLVNPWGISASPTSPFWVSDNGTGVSTLYRGDGSIVPLVVTIPPPASSPMTTTATPTGNVFNDVDLQDGFVVTKTNVSGPSLFIFATEDGTISGWNPRVDPTHAVLAVDNSAAGAVYKGLAIARGSKGPMLYATNFHAGTVDMFDEHFQPAGSFTDVSLSSTCPLPGQCFAPFGIRAIGGKLLVTFALQKPGKHDDQAGPGNGFVDVFDPDGHLLRRFASQGTLNSPWGLALAPANFGRFSRDLLVGNFGDGRINAFDPYTGAFLGQLTNRRGLPITINGLWGLIFGNGAAAGPRNHLFFTAGIADEQHGLFGTIIASGDD